MHHTQRTGEKKTTMAEKAQSALSNYLPLHQMTFDEMMGEGVKTVAQVTGKPSLVDKDKLIGVPFIVIDFTTRVGSYRRDDGELGDYISVTIKTKDNDLLVFNDGGTGIAGQLASVDLEKDLPLYCPQGLRKSEYTNSYGPALTYYLA